MVLIWASAPESDDAPSVEVSRAGTRYDATLRYSDGRTEIRRYEWRSKSGLREVGGYGDP